MGELSGEIHPITALSKIYKEKIPQLRCAETRLNSFLEEVVLAIEDNNLVRAEVLSVRIKKLRSLQQKAKKHGWDANQALRCCGDLLGARVVCNNIQDVRRFAELLKEHLPLSLDYEFDVQDYISEPKEGGYRALHINCMMDLAGKSFIPDSVPCEVQIRTRLQNSWAELSHDDIYKQSADLPEDLRARTQDLAEVLAAADKIAADIRERVMREIHAPAHQPDMGNVSTEGLAYSFKEVFGRSPSEYSVRRAKNLCDRLHLTTLNKFSELLKSSEFRDKVAKAYQSIPGLSISYEDIFLSALYAAAGGQAKAIKWIRKKALRVWREIETIATNEILSSLPETVEDFFEELKNPDLDYTDIERWAEALGTTKNCTICSTTVIQLWAFAEAIVQYFELSDEDGDVMERIVAAIEPSGLETGGWGDGSLCAYHNAQGTKDD